jgi:hypothetical protein
MDNIVLYCKSYHRDVQRAKVLFESIQKHNKDGIKFFVTVPQDDLKLFRDVLGTANYTLIPDEEITKMYVGWVGQQIAKAQFWKLGFCENYLCLDSDSQFMRDFTKADFMFTDTIPYTVCHENKDFFETMEKFPMPFDPYESYKKERLAVMELFDRKGVIYDFGPSPVIWSRKVWESLEANYFKPNGLTFEDAIQSIPSEFTWYGEWLLTNKDIPIYPRGAIFRSFHYKHLYEMERSRGLTLKMIAKYYLGYILNTSWDSPLTF